MPWEVKPSLRLRPEKDACYVCGPNNPLGLHVPFAREGAHGTRALYTARAEHCGWPGLLHGGVAFALMDEALAYALYFQGLSGVTARVETRFRQPIPIGTKLTIRAWTLDRRRQLIDARAELRLDSPLDPPLGPNDKPLVAEAHATMYLQDTAMNQND